MNGRTRDEISYGVGALLLLCGGALALAFVAVLIAATW